MTIFILPPTAIVVDEDEDEEDEEEDANLGD